MLLDEGSFAEEALLANWQEEGLGADGVVTGNRDGRRADRRADGQRPDREGGLLGSEDRREDPAHPGARADARRCRWSIWSTRPARGSPSRCRCSPAGAERADLPQPGEALGRRAAGLRAVRPERRRRRLHPRLLRHRDHARGQRVDVPRLAAHGRDGDRREGDARGDGRRAHAHRRLGLRPPARRERRGGHPDGAPLPLLPARQLRARAAASAARPPPRALPERREHRRR